MTRWVGKAAEAEIQAFAQHLSERGFSHSTISDHIGGLRRLAQALQAEGVDLAHTPLHQAPPERITAVLSRWQKALRPLTMRRSIIVLQAWADFVRERFGEAPALGARTPGLADRTAGSMEIE